MIASDEVHRRELHDYERPMALMMLQKAEQNRDPKRQRKPFKIDDFYFYKDPEKDNAPDGRYGAAANELLRLGKFPSWALFIYPDLKKHAEKATVPSPVALISEWAIILAPNCENGVCTGLLIASNESSGTIQEFEGIGNLKILLRIPFFKEATFASEDAELQIVS